MRGCEGSYATARTMSPRDGSTKARSRSTAAVSGQTFASGLTGAKSFWSRGARRAARIGSTFHRRAAGSPLTSLNDVQLLIPRKYAAREGCRLSIRSARPRSGAPDGIRAVSMQTQVEIAFRHYEPSDDVRAQIAAQSRRLEKFSPRITSCRVVVTG